MNPRDAYIAAFTARCAPSRDAGRTWVDEPGVRGLLPSAEWPARLLVTDDDAAELLTELLPSIPAGTVNAFAQAERCCGLLRADSAWRASSGLTAMVSPDLASVDAVALPEPLSLRPVRHRSDGAADGVALEGGVALEDAVACAIRASPSAGDPPGALERYLRSLPSTATHLLAAVDEAGIVRATSGAIVTGRWATVIFVDTDPDWQGRGVARGMTAAALAAARTAGAAQAGLDASGAGLSIYRHLGFEPVAPTTHFMRQS